MAIKFGTSGWRGIIADDFTYNNVKLVTQAIADYVKQKDAESAVIVGGDTRFLSEEFAKISSCILAGNGIKALLSIRDIPTPVISYEILRRKLSGGINFTASHNPPEYNGIKFTPSWGGPALPETTKEIERRCEILSTTKEIKEIDFEEGKRKGLIQEIDGIPPYLKRIRELVDLKVIKKAKLKIGVDLLYGTARGYLDELLGETGCKLTILHNYRDVLFGGAGRPEPDKERLEELRTVIKKEKLSIGLSCDGDADRFGIIDSDGSFITPNMILGLLLNHLIKSRKLKGVVARSVMTSHFVDAVAKKYGVEVRETPVGFKFIGEIMTKEPMVIGGEESGGLTIFGHIPEKDGILACLLMAEMVAFEGKPIRKILAELYKEVGCFYTERLNFHLTQKVMDELKEKLANNKVDFDGFEVRDVIKIDGHKFLFKDNCWLGVRLSGTEPVVRVYIEANSEEKFKKLLKVGKKMVNVN